MSKVSLSLGLLLASVLPLSARAEGGDADLTSLTESSVVEVAAKHNPGLRASILQLESARWDVFGTEAKYDPVLQVDGSGQQTETPSLFRKNLVTQTRRADLTAELRKHLIWGTDLSLRVNGNVQKLTSPSVSGSIPIGAGGGAAGTFGPAYGVLAKFELKQPLIRGRGRTVGEADLIASRTRRTAAEHTRDRVASELLRDALTAYWELWYADAALDIQQKARDVAMRQRDDAQARVNTGALAPADVLAFETQVATREEDVVNAQLERHTRELVLLQQLGLIETKPTLALADRELPEVSAPGHEVAEQRALAESAELRELFSQLELARVQNRTAADPQRARLDFDAYIQTQGLANKDANAALNQFGTFGAVTAFAGLTYEAPLTSTSYRAAAAKARVAVEVAEENLRQGRQRVVNDVRTALERQAAGQRKVELAAQTATIAQRQLEAEQARFQTGTSTSLQVLQAEDQVRSANIRLARARADLLESALVLQHLTGDLVRRYAALHQ